MAGHSVTFWRRVAQVTFVAVTMIILIPYILPPSLLTVDKIKYKGTSQFSTNSSREFTETYHSQILKLPMTTHTAASPAHSPPPVQAPRSQHPYLHPSPHKCDDPYLEAGYLTSNVSNTSENYWTPFNPECPRGPHFIQGVIDRKPLPWLQGKTLLMVGDSVDRNNLRFFCELAGSTNMRVTSMSNLSEALLGDTDLDPGNIDPGDLTRPRVCRVDEYDFEIIMFFHYGMQEEEIWTAKNVYTPPGIMEQRVPLVKGLLADYGRRPDMIILGSGTRFTPDLTDFKVCGILRGG